MTASDFYEIELFGKRIQQHIPIISGDLQLRVLYSAQIGSRYGLYVRTIGEIPRLRAFYSKTSSVEDSPAHFALGRRGDVTIGSLYPQPLILPVNSTIGDYIVSLRTDSLLFEEVAGDPKIRFAARRLGTTLAVEIAKRLYELGVDEMLAL